MTNSIKVTYVPGTAKEVFIEDGMTINEILEVANMDTIGRDIRVDGVNYGLNDELPSDSTVITLVKKIKGNSEEDDNMKMIKVTCVPGTPKEVYIDNETTVGEAVDMSGLDTQGRDIRLDGNAVELDSIIPMDTTVITLVKKIKGNSNMVKVTYVPGTPKEFYYEDGISVREIVDSADMHIEGREVRVDGENINLDDTLPAGASIITLVKKIKGNCDFVKVTYVPGTPREVYIEDGMTIQEVIDASEMDISGRDIRVDGVRMDLDSKLPKDTTVITLVKKIKGNK